MDFPWITLAFLPQMQISNEHFSKELGVLKGKISNMEAPLFHHVVYAAWHELLHWLAAGRRMNARTQTLGHTCIQQVGHQNNKLAVFDFNVDSR